MTEQEYLAQHAAIMAGAGSSQPSGNTADATRGRGRNGNLRNEYIKKSGGIIPTATQSEVDRYNAYNQYLKAATDTRGRTAVRGGLRDEFLRQHPDVQHDAPTSLNYALTKAIKDSAPQFEMPQMVGDTNWLSKHPDFQNDQSGVKLNIPELTDEQKAQLRNEYIDAAVKYRDSEKALEKIEPEYNGSFNTIQSDYQAKLKAARGEMDSAKSERDSIQRLLELYGMDIPDVDQNAFQRAWGALKGGAKQAAGSLGGAVGALGRISSGGQAAVDKALSATGNENLSALYNVSSEEENQKAMQMQQSIADKSAEIAQSGGADIENAKAGSAKIGNFEVGNFVVDALSQVPAIVGDMVANVVLPGSGIVLLGARSFGGGVQEAESQGADLGSAATYGAANAAAEVLSEKIFGGLDLAYGEGFTRKAVEKAIGKMMKSDTGRTALRVIVNSAEEGLGEVLADAANPVTRAIYNGKSIGENYSEEQISDWIYDFAIGATLGLAGQGVSIATGENAQRNRELRGTGTEAQTQTNAAPKAQQRSNADVDAVEALTGIRARESTATNAAPVNPTDVQSIAAAANSRTQLEYASAQVRSDPALMQSLRETTGRNLQTPNDVILALQELNTKAKLEQTLRAAVETGEDTAIEEALFKMAQNGDITILNKYYGNLPGTPEGNIQFAKRIVNGDTKTAPAQTETQRASESPSERRVDVGEQVTPPSAQNAEQTASERLNQPTDTIDALIGNIPDKTSLQQQANSDKISTTKVERAKELLANGATPSQVFNETGMVVTSSGTITDGFGGKEVGRVDTRRKGRTDEVSDLHKVAGTPESGVSGDDGRGVRRGLHNETGEKASWESLSAEDRNRAAEIIQNRLDSVETDEADEMRLAYDTDEELAHAIYNSYKDGRAALETWTKYFGDMDALADELDNAGLGKAVAENVKQKPKSKISSFRGEYSFLSNMHPAKVTIDGVTYNSAEAAFQAQKSTDAQYRESLKNASGSEAKSLGRKAKLRSDWEYEKLDIMRDVLMAKFSQNQALKGKLLATGDAELVEGNSWGDSFWGVADGFGANNLGKLLMSVRDELAKNSSLDSEASRAPASQVSAEADYSAYEQAKAQAEADYQKTIQRWYEAHPGKDAPPPGHGLADKATWIKTKAKSILKKENGERFTNDYYDSLDMFAAKTDILANKGMSAAEKVVALKEAGVPGEWVVKDGEVFDAASAEKFGLDMDKKEAKSYPESRRYSDKDAPAGKTQLTSQMADASARLERLKAEDAKRFKDKPINYDIPNDAAVRAVDAGKAVRMATEDELVRLGYPPDAPSAPKFDPYVEADKSESPRQTRDIPKPTDSAELSAMDAERSQRADVDENWQSLRESDLNEINNAKEYAEQQRYAGGDNANPELDISRVYGNDTVKTFRGLDERLGKLFDEQTLYREGAEPGVKSRRTFSRLQNGTEAIDAARKVMRGEISVDEFKLAYDNLKDNSRTAYLYTEDISNAIKAVQNDLKANTTPGSAVEVTQEKAAKDFVTAMQMLTHRAELAAEYKPTSMKLSSEIESNSKLPKAALGLFKKRSTPDTFWKALGGYSRENGSAAYAMADEALQNNATEKRERSYGYAFFDKLSKHKDYKAFAQNKLMSGYTVEIDGESIEFTAQELVSLVHSLRSLKAETNNYAEGLPNSINVEHDGESITLFKKKGDKPNNIAALNELQQSAEAKLSGFAKEYSEALDKMFEHYSSPFMDAIRDTTGIEHDLDLDKSKNYFPLFYGNGKAKAKFDIGEAVKSRFQTTRFAKEREGAGDVLSVRPVAKIAESYIEQVSHYIAWSRYSNKLNMMNAGIDGTGSFISSIAESYSDGAAKIMQDYVADVGGYRERNHSAVNDVLSKFAGAVITGRPTTAFSQLSSVYAIGGIVKPEAIRRSGSIFPSKKSHINLDDGLLRDRERHGINDSTITEIARNADSKIKNAIEKIPGGKAYLNLVGIADSYTTKQIYAACWCDVDLDYHDLRKSNPKLFDTLVEDKFTEALLFSQSDADSVNNAAIYRTNSDIEKAVAMFTNQPNKQLNMIMTAIGEYNAATGKAKDAAGKTLKGVISGQIGAAVSYSMLKAVAQLALHKWYPFKDDEDEDKLSWKNIGLSIASETVSTLVGVVPYADLIADGIMYGISGGKLGSSYDLQITGVSKVMDLINDLTDQLNIVNGHVPTAREIKRIALDIVDVTGVPLEGAYDFVNAFALWGVDAYNYFTKGESPAANYDLARLYDERSAFNKRVTGKSTLEGVFSALIGKGVTDERKGAQDAIRALYDETDSQSSLPPEFSGDVTKDIELTGKEKEKYGDNLLDMFYGNFEKVYDTDLYKNADTEYKQAIVDALKKYSVDQAKREYLKDSDEEFTSDYDKLYESDIPQESIPEYISYKASLSKSQKDGNYDTIDALIGDFDKLPESTQKQLEDDSLSINKLLYADSLGINSKAWYRSKDAVDKGSETLGGSNEASIISIYLDMAGKSDEEILDAIKAQVTPDAGGKYPTVVRRIEAYNKVAGSNADLGSWLRLVAAVEDADENGSTSKADVEAAWANMGLGKNSRYGGITCDDLYNIVKGNKGLASNEEYATQYDDYWAERYPEEEKERPNLSAAFGK